MEYRHSPLIQNVVVKSGMVLIIGETFTKGSQPELPRSGAQKLLLCNRLQNHPLNFRGSILVVMHHPGIQIRGYSHLPYDRDSEILGYRCHLVCVHCNSRLENHLHQQRSHTRNDPSGYGPTFRCYWQCRREIPGKCCLA